MFIANMLTSQAVVKYICSMYCVESACQAVLYENCNYFRNQHFIACGDVHVDELFCFLTAVLVAKLHRCACIMEVVIF
jgi:hypothetical protein